MVGPIMHHVKPRETDQATDKAVRELFPKKFSEQHIANCRPGTLMNPSFFFLQ